MELLDCILSFLNALQSFAYDVGQNNNFFRLSYGRDREVKINMDFEEKLR